MTLLTDSLVGVPMKTGQQPVFVGFHLVVRIMFSWLVIATLLPSSAIAGPARTGEADLPATMCLVSRSDREKARTIITRVRSWASGRWPGWRA